jgi:translation initiation factor IF-2
MSEEKNIRINKVLRELNISLERAVDYLKDKGVTIEASPNTKISESEYTILCNEFAGDKGNKEASKEVIEEKRKEKEALRLEREKEELVKKQQEEELLKQQQEVIKAKATVSGPKQVGKIDLESKKQTVPEKEIIEEKELPISNVVDEIKTNQQPKEIRPVKKDVIVEKNAQISNESNDATQLTEEKFETKYQKLSGATITGQKIDLSQFDKPKKKKEEPKIQPNKPANQGGISNDAKNKRKRIPSKPGANSSQGLGQGNGQGNNRPQQGKPSFNKGVRPAIVAKVEPTEEEVQKQIREPLEKLQGKGNKSKAAKYRRDKRETHRQRSDDELKAIEEGSKILKVT